ncbi:MAG: twin transmembrane helix small protein [Hahellaceae bacterium]|nr:twin transmembrane helix small protein [Hahellaceae bacterium]
MKIVIGLLLLGAVVSLFSGLFFLVRDGSDQKRTVKALTFRIGFGIALFVVVQVMLATGQLHLNPSPIH